MRRNNAAYFVFTLVILIVILGRVNYIMQSSEATKKGVFVHFNNDTVGGNPFSLTTEKEFSLRLNAINKFCTNSTIEGGNIKGVFRFENQKAIYCFVPKAGCTFWKRMYILMHSNSGITKKTLFSVNRSAVHDITRQGSLYNGLKDTPTNFPVRFQVSRNPISRLISSYLDKVYLPGFWFTEIAPLLKKQNLRGENMSKANEDQDFLRRHFEGLHSLYGNLTRETRSFKSTRDDARCGKYATFREFVQLSLDRKEPHWMPMTELCEPCKFKPSHIARMESFLEDSATILKHLGVNDVLEHLNKQDVIDEEIKTIVKYNFEHVQVGRDKTGYSFCVSYTEIAHRLWSNFQWRGYTHPDVEYVPSYSKDVNIVMEDLLLQLKVAREKGLADVAAMKASKTNFSKRVLLTLPNDLFQAVLEKYKLDFKLFGYEKERKESEQMYLQHRV